MPGTTTTRTETRDPLHIYRSLRGHEGSVLIETGRRALLAAGDRLLSADEAERALGAYVNREGQAVFDAPAHIVAVTKS